jgi:hypothetical protein
MTVPETGVDTVVSDDEIEQVVTGKVVEVDTEETIDVFISEDGC